MSETATVLAVLAIVWLAGVITFYVQWKER